MKTLALLCTLLLFSMPAQARDNILDIQEVKSKSGITAWLIEDNSVPVISLQFAFKGAGARNDSAYKQGLSRLASNTMDEGAGDIPSQAFQKTLRDNSITLFFNTTRDNFGGSLKTLTRNKAAAFELLRLAVNEPRFDDAPVARMIKANQARIRNSLAKPGWIAARLMNDRGYEGHPYALNSGGTISTLSTLTRDDLVQFQEERLARNNLHIAVSGDISANELSKAIDDIFGALPKRANLSDTPALTLQNQGNTYFYEKDIPQSFIEMLQPAIDRTHPDYHAAQIMNFILGSSGFGSRLTEEIREKRGLTYGIYSSIQSTDKFAGLSVSTSTQGENTPKMLELIRQEWVNMRNGISEEELQNAKSYLIGSLPLSLTTTDSIAKTALSIKLDGLGSDYLDKRNNAIQDATLKDIQGIAEQLLNTEQFVTVIVGKQADGVDNAIVINEIPNAQ